MTVLGRYGANALKYWGSILASAYKGASTADMWTAIRQQQTEYGLPTPQASAPDVSVIRGYANRLVAASQALSGAQPTDTILPSMMATAPYTANDAAGIATAPTYTVRYQVTSQKTDGTQETRWSVSIFTPTDMPSTVGDLQTQIDFNASEMLAQAAQQTGGESGGILVGTGNIEISVA